MASVFGVGRAGLPERHSLHPPCLGLWQHWPEPRAAAPAPARPPLRLSGAAARRNGCLLIRLPPPPSCPELPGLACPPHVFVIGRWKDRDTPTTRAQRPPLHSAAASVWTGKSNPGVGLLQGRSPLLATEVNAAPATRPAVGAPPWHGTRAAWEAQGLGSVCRAGPGGRGKLKLGLNRPAAAAALLPQAASQACCCCPGTPCCSPCRHPTHPRRRGPARCHMDCICVFSVFFHFKNPAKCRALPSPDGGKARMGGRLGGSGGRCCRGGYAAVVGRSTLGPAAAAQQ
jgi:hypothetical protein